MTIRNAEKDYTEGIKIRWNSNSRQKNFEILSKLKYFYFFELVGRILGIVMNEKYWKKIDNNTIERTKW